MTINNNLSIAGFLSEGHPGFDVIAYLLEALNRTVMDAGGGSISQPAKVDLTAVSATPGTARAIYGKYTTFTTMTSGNLVGVRGEITGGGNMTGTAFLYGAQGKFIPGAHTVDIGSSYGVGVLGQIDVTGSTITSGYVAGVASDIFGVSAGLVPVDLFVGNHADGGTINSMLKLFAKATYVFDLSSNGGGNIIAAGAATTNSGALKVKINGVDKYINLYSTAP